MMFIAVTGVGLIALLASLVYLIEFAKASRGDALFTPASTGHVRRARRITGMYARGTEDIDLHETDGQGQLVDH
jgi:hypothetical protein